MADERQVEWRGLALMKQKRLWAGVVFVETSDPAGLLTYKIRMDEDRVDGTNRWFDRCAPASEPFANIRVIRMHVIVVLVASASVLFCIFTV